MRPQLFPATANHRFVLPRHGHLWTEVHVALTSQPFARAVFSDATNPESAWLEGTGFWPVG
ncbi:MAG: hypothetical protein QF595_07420 [Dehalococcoidia bacterium]|jgi:hypothetical protein|nr:hypothetical protein [Dehalococcoidia bacterium]